jgi:hypothetical protein
MKNEEASVAPRLPFTGALLETLAYGSTGPKTRPLASVNLYTGGIYTACACTVKAVSSLLGLGPAIDSPEPHG